MTLRDRLERVVEGLPPDASVTLPVARLRAWIEEEGDAVGLDRLGLTVEQVAEKVGKKPSTVRGWLNEGRLKGRKPTGSEWRVAPADLAEFMAGDQESDSHGDLSAWREEAA